MKQNSSDSENAVDVVSLLEPAKIIHTSDEEFVHISESKEFNELLSKKKKFLVPMIIFFMLFYFALPLLTSFTRVLHQKAIGEITWVWIFAFAQFIMVWVLATIYVSKANKFDKQVNMILEKKKSGDYL